MLRNPLIPAIPALFVLSLVPSSVSGQAVELQVGQTLQGTLAPGDTAEYAVEIGDDSFVFGEVDQISVDVVLRILDGAGQQRARVDVLGRGAERYASEVEEGGRYTVQVFPDEDEDGGDYTVTLRRLEPVATDPARLVAQLMSPYDSDDTPGVAVQAWRNGETLFSDAYGMANLAYHIPFETDTRTNIGSTSKQFTAFAVSLLAQRGDLSLDDAIRTHLPELPVFADEVTIRHLLTHTSGLREFLNLLVMTGRRLDHGDYVDRDEIIDIVQRQPALQNAPGAEWNYNNTAFALAAEIVTRVSGQPFHEFMAENVFQPLGMSHTMVRPSPEAIVPDHSRGYLPGDRGYREARDLGAAVGAGGIYASVEDLQRWVENYSAPEVGDEDMVEEMMTPYVLTDGDTTDYGYGLFIDRQRGLRRVHHGGADVAHRSMLAYYPEIDGGITVQSNLATFDSNVAFRLAEAFFGDAMEPEDPETATADAPFDPEAYEPEDFDVYVGRYELDAAPGVFLRFFREADTLLTQVTGQQRVEIVPRSDSTFALTAVPATITFHRDEEGGVEGLTLHQGGQEQHATRVEGDSADPWEPTAEQLDAFTGRYFSEEVETFYEVVVDEGALVLRHRRLDDIELSPGEEDTFSGGGLTVDFERDRNGRIIAFYMSNVRTRDVRFDRMR